MHRRRTPGSTNTRHIHLQNISDASFQIPYAVNATSNNLLLDDDTLDFFNGVDYTLSTPVQPHTQPSNELQRVLMSDQLSPTPDGRTAAALGDEYFPISSVEQPRSRLSSPILRELILDRKDNRESIHQSLSSPSTPKVAASSSFTRSVAPTPTPKATGTSHNRPEVETMNDDEDDDNLYCRQQEDQVLKTQLMMVSHSGASVPYASELARAKGETLDAVTASTVEGQEDLQSIPKSGSSVPTAATGTLARQKSTFSKRLKEASPLRTNKSKTKLKPKMRLKRKSDMPGAQPAAKKKKTDLTLASSGPNFTDSENVHDLSDALSTAKGAMTKPDVTRDSDDRATASAVSPDEGMFSQSHIPSEIDNTKEDVHFRNSTCVKVLDLNIIPDIRHKRVMDADSVSDPSPSTEVQVESAKENYIVSGSRTVEVQHNKNYSEVGKASKTRVRGLGSKKPPRKALSTAQKCGSLKNAGASTQVREKAAPAPKPTSATSILPVSQEANPVNLTCLQIPRETGTEIIGKLTMAVCTSLPEIPPSETIAGPSSSKSVEGSHPLKHLDPPQSHSIFQMSESSNEMIELQPGDTERAHSALTDVPMGQSNSRSLSSKDPQSGPKRSQVKSCVDDMFMRKKRDTYLQKGIDLRAHSTSRFQRSENNKPGATSNRYSASTRSSRAHATTSQTAMSSKRARKTRKITTLASDPDNKDICADNARDPSQLNDARNREVNGKSSTSDVYGDIGKLRDNEAILNEEQEDPANKSSSSISNAISERLFHFGQSIINSIGIFGSHGEVVRPKNEALESNVHIVSDDHDLGRGQSRNQSRTSSLRLSDLSPRKPLRTDAQAASASSAAIAARSNHDQGPHKSSTVPSNDARNKAVIWSNDRNDENNTFDGADSIPPRTARKLSSKQENDVVPIEEKEPGRIDERSMKKKRKISGQSEMTMIETESLSEVFQLPTKVVDTETRSSTCTDLAKAEINASGPTMKSADISQKQLITSRTGPSLSSGALNSTGSSDYQRENSARLHTKLDTSHNVKASCGLTVPIAITFVGDILKEKRALAKSEREYVEREKVERVDGLCKSANAVSNSKSNSRNSTRPPLSEKQNVDGPPLKRTMPQAFQFETDARVTHRRQDFAKKLEAWETRSSNTSSNPHKSSNSRKPIPDFKSIHASQEKALSHMAERRREQLNPTIPVSPNFPTNQRISEREKYDEGRRAREKEAERLIEEKRREQEVEEERELREARKRTVPRAHAIPEWYSQAPKRVRDRVE